MTAAEVPLKAAAHGGRPLARVRIAGERGWLSRSSDGSLRFRPDKGEERTVEGELVVEAYWPEGDLDRMWTCRCCKRRLPPAAHSSKPKVCKECVPSVLDRARQRMERGGQLAMFGGSDG